MKKHPQKKNGFTLVELSIVLVIIGLIAGATLVGNSLIEAAKLRNLSAQIESLDGAVRTFQSKYDCFPGDCRKATRHFASAGCPDGNGDPTTTCDGDGNGYIQYPTSGTNSQRREHLKFWQHLALAGLIEGQYTGIGGAGDLNVHTIIGENIPSTAIPDLGIIVFNLAPVNTVWPWLYGDNRGLGVHILQLGTEVSGSTATAGKLTLKQMIDLDTKMDDGLAKSGKVGVTEAMTMIGTTGCTIGGGFPTFDGNFTYGTSMDSLCSMLVFENW